MAGVLTPTPWWHAVRLRREVTSSSGTIDDVQMSLYGAVYGEGTTQPPYADAAYYGEITYPSPNLVGLMARIAVRLGAGDRYLAAPCVYHLDQGMGGGKSHGLIGLWHLAAHPNELVNTDVGAAALAQAAHIASRRVALDRASPHVVVLPCDHMTPSEGAPHLDGPGRTLHERFLWRLFSGDRTLYDRYSGRPDKAGVGEALTALGRPVLILFDEIMDYVRQLSASQHADLAVHDMGFLRALLDVANDVPHVALVVVMIRSEDDPMALDADGQARRVELDQLLVRNGNTATVTAATDFAEILRRRLFDASAPSEVVDATAQHHREALRGAWRTRVFATLGRQGAGEFRASLRRSYPFHPALIELAETEWAPIAGFQKVRSTMRIFAATAFALSERGAAGAWAPPLIGPGDLLLSVGEVREALLGSGLIADDRTQANYRQVAAADVVSDDDRTGAARTLDREREDDPWLGVNPRAAERCATALFVYSISPRGQGRRGATEPELKAASFVPDDSYGIADADVVLAELQEPERGLAALEVLPGKGGQPTRLYLSTRQTLSMFFRQERSGVSDGDRDELLARTAERLAKTGPFKNRVFVEAPGVDHDERPSREILASAGIDDARATRLVVLDPRRFTFLNGVDEDTRAAMRAALGLGEDRLPVQWASSAVFAVANTQRRRLARQHAAVHLAWKRVCEIDAVAADPELLEKARDERDQSRRQFEDAVRRAYQHVVYLGLDEDGQTRTDLHVRFDIESMTALDGAIVWAKLVEQGKAFGVGTFTPEALIHNLMDEDYGRPLDELRDLFWSTPRLPLLPGGEGDLQQAIFSALQQRSLRLIGADGVDRAVAHAGEIAVGSPGLRLAKPLTAEPEEPTETGEVPVEEGAGIDGGDIGAASDVTLGFTVRTSLTDSERRDRVWRLFDAVARALDEDAHHLEAAVNLTLPQNHAEDIEKRATDAGANPQITDLS